MQHSCKGAFILRRITARGKTVKTYHFQLVARDQANDAVRRFICSDDAEALLLAEKMTKGTIPAEIWDGDRLVGKLSAPSSTNAGTHPG